jgi:NAD(P)-dependent dehydrogenase (short-subunit alcohol dehydrogenase family)
MAEMKRTLENYFSLEGRVGIITGAGGGLCGEMARALGALGARIAVLDLIQENARKVVEDIRREGGEAEAHPCSVLDRGQLQEVEAAVRRRWGVPDFLINGAGGNDPRGSTSMEFLERGTAPAAGERSFFELEPEAIDATFALNFQGTVLPTQVFARGMVERGSGCVLNISSMNAFTPLTKIPAYAAAKAAVANFTRWLAVHFAHTGVRVNALAPGFFLTEQLRFLYFDKTSGEPTPRARKVIEHTPMGRYGEPEDLLGAVIWLLSDSARFVTGTLVAIDGGFSAYSI